MGRTFKLKNDVDLEMRNGDTFTVPAMTPVTVVGGSSSAPLVRIKGAKDEKPFVVGKRDLGKGGH